MSGRVLHVLSQRPSRTGSGITLDAIVRLARESGWVQGALVGVPVSANPPSIGDLPATAVFPVTFHDDSAPDLPADLPFPVPGMSDVMPYPSTVWSDLTAKQLEQYRHVWREHLSRVIAAFKPDIIHTNHVWLMSSLLPLVAPGIPLLATCHATGLRQMELCTHLRSEVISGCRSIGHFFALRQDHRVQLAEIMAIPEHRISVIGVGFRDDIFFPDPSVSPETDALLFVGKFSHAKGLSCLLEALEKLREHHPQAVLHVAGDGAGNEAEELRQRMRAMSPAVIMHGQLDQPRLANLMRRCQVCVLPSFYEGVPLVLAEAGACGCRIVASELPGVKEQLAPHLGDTLQLVPLPNMAGIDTPAPGGLPAFIENLHLALGQALEPPASQLAKCPEDTWLTPLTWRSVFERVELIWKKIISDHEQG